MIWGRRSGRRDGEDAADLGIGRGEAYSPGGELEGSLHEDFIVGLRRAVAGHGFEDIGFAGRMPGRALGPACKLLLFRDLLSGFRGRLLWDKVVCTRLRMAFEGALDME